MAEKPRIMELVKGSIAFARDHQDHFWYVVKPLLPFILACDVLAYIIGQYTDAGRIFSLLSAYFVACFALAWHRAVLQGPSSSDLVDPFNIKAHDRPFLAAFFAILIVPFLALIVGGVIAVMVGEIGTVAAAVAYTALTVFILWGVYEVMRVTFMLPGKAVGAEMNMKRARALSKGLIMRWVLAVMVIGIPYALGTMIYSFLAVTVVHYLFGFLGAGLPMYILDAAVLAPVFFVGIIWAGLNVAILSRLYQWGVEHNI